MRISNGLTSLFASLFIAATAFAAEDALPGPETLLPKALVSEGDQGRLREFFKKAEAGDSLVLGVLGGSITQGAACSKPELRYHGVMLSWLKAKFPKAKFSLVNAGVGATPSDYGALRAERDLLSKKPSLVVLEYAVNDCPVGAPESPKSYAETYEGAVRQILKAQGRPALLLLFMMWEDGRNSQDWQAKIGAHYKVPMISYRDALWPELQAGRLKWKRISPDGVHPNQDGHAFAGGLIAAFLEKAYSEYKAAKGAASPLEAKLPPPLLTSTFENCVLLEGDSLKPNLNEGWVFDQGEKGAPPGWRSSKPGSVIEFEVPGEAIIVSYWRTQKQPMGMAKVSVDGGAPRILDGWFDASWGGKRWSVRVADGLKPGPHKLRFELLPEKNPQSSGNEFRIPCVGGCDAK